MAAPSTSGEKRPIRIQWSREESIIGHHKRHRASVHTKWGATRDGKITAVEADVYLDAGAYNYTSNKVLGNFHLTVGGAYEIPRMLGLTATVSTRTPYPVAPIVALVPPKAHLSPKTR